MVGVAMTSAPRSSRGGGRGHGYRGHHVDAGGPIDLHEAADFAMNVHRLAGVTQHFGQHALRLAQRIAEQHRIAPAFAIDLPPAHDVADDGGGVGPHEVRLAEGRLADEHIALQGLERRAGRIRLAFVVTGDHPYLPVMLEAHLGRAQDMAGRVQREGHGP